MMVTSHECQESCFVADGAGFNSAVFDIIDFYARERRHPDCVFSRAVIPGAHSNG